ncbi:hypothetical protein Golax_007593, partial [Gossypium laxum]|nr:hypothetical protein [Gossypium laxum]
MEALVTTAAEQLDLAGASCMLTENGGKILDVDMINDGEKLYLIVGDCDLATNNVTALFLYQVQSPLVNDLAVSKGVTSLVGHPFR